MFTDLTGKTRLKIGLHTHTTLSDGHKTPEEAAAIYKAAGYDAIAITDHWVYGEGGEIDGLTILSGCEYNVGGVDEGTGVHETYHIVGIGMTRDPEIPEDYLRNHDGRIRDRVRDIVDRMNYTKSLGKHHFIVMVAEGIGDVSELAKDIEKATGVETRATVLGHVQRGGAPTGRDRVNATKMGYLAVELLLAGISNRVVCEKDGQIIDIDIQEGLSMKKQLPKEMMLLAKKLAF